MPPRSGKGKGKKPPPEPTELELQWQNIISKQYEIIEDIKEYVIQNHIELFMKKMGGLIPEGKNTYRTLFKLWKDNTNANMGIQVNYLYNYYSNYTNYTKYAVDLPSYIKEIKNLLYKRCLGRNNDDIYNIIIHKYLNGITTTYGAVIALIQLCVAIGYSIDKLVVRAFTCRDTYAICIFNPDSTVQNGHICSRPITLEEYEKQKIEATVYNSTGKNVDETLDIMYIYASDFLNIDESTL